MKSFVLAAVSAAALLTACGGGGNSGETKAKITSVKVVGASLADSGTFGYKFTVQSGTGTPYKVYPERIAATYGVNLCAHYTVSGGTPTAPTFAANAACTNYAVAGSAVSYYVETSATTGLVADSVPTSAIKQLTDLGTAGLSANDLVIVGEFGANDAATLAEKLGDYQSSSSPHYGIILGTLLDSTTITANASRPDIQGVLYMQALADKLTAAIKTNLLDKGATRVAVLNTLDITKTPKFQAKLAALSSVAAAQTTAIVNAWVQAYNARLAQNLAAYGSKVAVVDFYTNFNAEMNDPAQYGLTNTSATVCDQIYSQANSVTPTVQTAGTTSLAPTYVSGAVVGYCKDTTASTVTPTQNNTGTTWWQTYLYADNFHPTPYGHQLLAQLVAKRLTEAGWL